MLKDADRAGLAPMLFSEYAKTRTASAIALFHRPVGEDAFMSGRAFYRAWLSMERAGFKDVPMSVLADWPVARNTLHGCTGSMRAASSSVHFESVGRGGCCRLVAHVCRSMS